MGPSIWEKWWWKVYPLTWDELYVEGEDLPRPSTYQTIYLLKNNPDLEFIDIVDTEKKETASDIFQLAFKEAAEDLLAWKEDHGDYYWGKYKATYLGHLLQGLPAFSRFDLPIGGNSNIVNATSKNHGPSWRMIVEMSSPPKAIGIYPGGQSGNPGSKHYDDFVDIWAGGNYLELLFMQNDTETNAIVKSQTLTPMP